MKRYLGCAVVSCLLLIPGGCGGSSAKPTGAGSGPPTRMISLPRDNAMHPRAHSEWWYVVGHLADRSGRRYGFETTLFKLNHLRFPGSGRTLSAYRADVAITDVAGHRYLHRVTYLEPGLGPIRLSKRSFYERIDGAKIWSSRKVIHVRSAAHGGRLELSLTSRRAPLLEGGRGLVPMGHGGFSYYYSLVDLRVGGRIREKNGHWIPVTGIAWMDHQWGSWKWSRIRGWTWGAFQLNNGVDFSAADFHTVGQSFHGVTISYPHKHQKTLLGVRIRPLGRWTSPHDRAIYASGWILSIPGAKARLKVEPLLRDQEMYDRVQPRTSYWEGACTVSGTFGGKRVSGRAYMEMVGPAGHFGSLSSG